MAPDEVGGFKPNGFIKYYINYHKLRTDAEERFATLLCIQMIGEALGYDCVHYVNPDVVRHNMYLALIEFHLEHCPDAPIGSKIVIFKLLEELSKKGKKRQENEEQN